MIRFIALSGGLATTLLFFASPGAAGAAAMTIHWTNNILTVSNSSLPGGRIEILYLEAFCRSGSTRRDWRQTTLPHRTRLISATPDGKRLEFRTRVEPGVEVFHEVRAGKDELEFGFRLTNQGSDAVDLSWFQPACIRVDRFTGGNQSNYIARSFIFTERGMTMMDRTTRREEALYRGGQVYVPKGIGLDDVNPRPISPDQPVNGLVGCVSADDQWLLATAWDRTHELFQGVYVCLHADPHVGGLRAGETKSVRGKLYLLKNDSKELLRRYQRDFGN
jgi:hypothetical protein